MQNRLLRSEVGTTMLKPDLPVSLDVGGNPFVRFKIADDVKEAMKHCELVVVSDCMANADT